MDIIICQTCGAVSKCTDTQCSNCGAAVTNDAEDQANWPPAEEDYVLSRSTVSGTSQRTPSPNKLDSQTPTKPDSQTPAKPSRNESGKALNSEIKRKPSTESSPRQEPKQVRQFTNTHMAMVLTASLVFVAIASIVFTLQSGYQISITFSNPFEQAIVWFAQLSISMKFMYVALGLGAVAVAAVCASYAYLSPNGIANVLEKKKYIPSQFKKQHSQELKLLNRPLQPGGMPLGVRREWRAWKPLAAKELTLTSKIRETSPHVLILGTSDKGKTRLMANMVVHDIEAAERAVVIVDSDGKLSELIARWISIHPNGKTLAKRISLLDPTQKNNSIGYNPLEMPEDGDLQSAASAIVYGFKAMYTELPNAQSQWSQQTAHILRSAVMLLMANGRTLADLPILLNDNDFRDVLLESIEKRRFERAEYTTLLETWGQYKKLARSEQWIPWVEPILNRVTPMLGDERIASILTKPVGDLRLKTLIEKRRVLIVKVPKGKLEQNGNVLGSLIVTGVKQAALSLSNETGAEHPPVALYLDEFDNFIEKETLESITSDTEEIKVEFIGAIDTLQQLPEDFRNQLTNGVHTMCCFTLTKKDADLLGPQMFRVDGRKIKIQTIQNFFNKISSSPQFELIADEEKLNVDRLVGQDDRTFFCYRVGTAAGVFNLQSHTFKDIPKSSLDQELIARMRRNF
ncbi:MAG: type IV secretory system conjugative DNA transfer family protein [Cyanobacteria bacterium SZAS-4]|nr:type IV secretory system conjugative DNA transfer family protein [Cyanobacteria bacterium SZAS-4]